jgi:hypothetical protein
MSTRKAVTPNLSKGHAHQIEDIATLKGAHIVDGATDATTNVAAAGATYSQSEVNAIQTAYNALATKYNALATKFNAVLVVLEENGLVAAS